MLVAFPIIWVPESTKLIPLVLSNVILSDIVPPAACIVPLALILPEAVMWPPNVSVELTYKLPDIVVVPSSSRCNTLWFAVKCNPPWPNLFLITQSGVWLFHKLIVAFPLPVASNTAFTLAASLIWRLYEGVAVGESPNWPLNARTYPLAFILPEAVIWFVTSKDPVIAESPFLCPVDKNVCEADTNSCPCQEPEMSVAIWAEEEIKPAKKLEEAAYVSSPPVEL